MLVLVAALITATVALLVAYWHRKQARQIELFRLDPSVGLEPPPSAVWQFLVRHQGFLSFLLTIVLPISGLTIVLSSPEPITRFTLIAIVLNSISLSTGVSNVSANALQKQIGRMAVNHDGTVRLIRDLNDGSWKAIDGIVNLIKLMTEGNVESTRNIINLIKQVNEGNDQGMRRMLDLISLRNEGIK